MKSLVRSAACALLCMACNTYAQDMTIIRNGDQKSFSLPARNATGSARVDPLFKATEPSRATGSTITFDAGAREAWHSHPLGQALIVTAGVGWVQQAGGPKMEIKPGDVIWTPPGVKHWHGATATTGMTHIGIQEALDGKNVEWFEPVTTEQYGS